MTKTKVAPFYLGHGVFICLFSRMCVISSGVFLHCCMQVVVSPTSTAVRKTPATPGSSKKHYVLRNIKTWTVEPWLRFDSSPGVSRPFLWGRKVVQLSLYWYKILWSMWVSTGRKFACGWTAAWRPRQTWHNLPAWSLAGIFVNLYYMCYCSVVAWVHSCWSSSSRWLSGSCLLCTVIAASCTVVSD